MKTSNKNQFASKKFFAFIMSQLILASILIIFLFTQTFNLPASLFMSIGILALTILPAAYIFNQKKLDVVKELMSSLVSRNTSEELELEEEEESDELD